MNDLGETKRDTVVLSHRRRSQSLFWTALLLVLLSSLSLSCYRIGEPLWEAGHHGFVLSEYPHNALNYLRYGYLDTRFGLVMNYGDSEPAGGFHYRVDHGPLTSILISLAYQVFGVSEWSARLVPVVLSVGTSLVVFFLTLELTDNRWTGLVALGLAALSPMQVYYARLPAPHNVAVFFSLLLFYVYYHWFATQRRIYLAGIFGLLAVGAYTDWIAYFVVPPILVHYLIFHRQQRNWWAVIGLALTPFLLFVSYVAWTYSLAGDNSLHGLWNTFLLRTSSSHNLDAAFSIVEVGRTFYERSRYWLTLPVVTLSVAWSVRFGWRSFRREVSRADGMVFVLFLFGLSHNVIFANRVMVHDFIMLYQLVPAFAMASATVLMWTVSSHLQRRTLFAVAAVVAVCTLFVAQSFRSLRAEHSKPVTYADSYYVGKALRETVSDSGSYIDGANLYENLGTLRTYVTADRPFKRVETLSEFKEARTDPRCEAVVVANSHETDASLREHLVEHYPRRNVSGHSVFRLNQQGSNALAEAPVIQNRYKVRFGAIEYLGFDVDRIVHAEDESVNWLEQYVRGHPELLPENRTTFTVTNYWRRTTDGSIDYDLATEFVAGNGRGHRLEQSHDGLDGLYPTSSWPVDKVVREAFTLTLPKGFPVASYSMWVSVADDTWNVPPNRAHPVTDQQNRVRVGQIYVRAESSDSSLSSKMSSRARFLNVCLEGGISVVRSRLSQQTVHPGDLLLVGLEWWAKQEIARNYKVFVHLMDPEGRLVAQHDAEPNLWRSPTSQWVPRTEVRDVDPLLVPAGMPSGTYRLRVGMYSERTKERLSVLDGFDTSPDRAITVGTVEVLSSHE